MNFDTKNETLRQLLSNGLTYDVPRFQRDYSWTLTEWEELWEDICDLFKAGSEPNHYMGYLVLKTSDSRHFNIIDGQQRITTLSIMILAIIGHLKELTDKNLDAENSKQRAEQFQNSYIGYLDPVSLQSQSKLTLSHNNDHFYRHYLTTHKSAPLGDLTTSDNQMHKAFQWFKEHVRERYGTTDESGEELARFLDTLVDKLFFTVITVADQLNAYKVFETLNARGVRLSATDLLKNYLFSIIDSAGTHKNKNDLAQLEQVWENIIEILGSEKFPKFLYVYWNSRNSKVRQTNLFKTIREKIKDKKSAFHLLHNLDRFSSVYVALLDPHAQCWNDKEKSAIRELEMFQVRQPLPMLMACYDKFYTEGQSQSGFTDIIRNVAVISIRYNVICNLPPNQQEKVYNNIACNVHDGTYSTPQEVTDALRVIYPEDRAFKGAFSDKELQTSRNRNMKIVRYLLFEIERQQSGGAFDMNDDTYSVEHILPRNPRKPCEERTEIDARKRVRMVDRIGNMTLLKTGQNRDLSNTAYSVKREVYKNSEFGITRDIAERYDTWNEENLASRQQRMANTAASIWKINFPN